MERFFELSNVWYTVIVLVISTIMVIFYALKWGWEVMPNFRMKYFEVMGMTAGWIVLLAPDLFWPNGLIGYLAGVVAGFVITVVYAINRLRLKTWFETKIKPELRSHPFEAIISFVSHNWKD